MQLIKNTLIILFGLIPFFLLAQVVQPNGLPTLKEESVKEKDTLAIDSQKIRLKIDPSSIYYLQTSYGQDSFKKWDSTFAFTHRFHRLQQNAMPYSDLGASGTPHKILLSSQLVPFGYFAGFTFYNQNNITLDSFKFYKARVPQSTFQYTQGNGPFIELRGMLTQNFGKNWNFTANLNSHTHNANIFNETSGVNQLQRSVAFGNLYISPNKKWIHSHVFTWNRARRNETFGYDTLKNYYASTSGFSKTLGFYNPRLTSAISIYKTHEHAATTVCKIEPTFYFYHKLTHLKSAYEFRNSSPALLSLFGSDGRFNKTKTIDSSVWNNWINQFGFGGGNSFYNWRAVWEASRGLHTSIYKNKSRINYLQAIHAEGDFNFSTFKLSGLTKFMLTGIQAGDFLFISKIANSHLEFGYTLQKHEPSQKNQLWVTNFHLFNSQLKQITHQRVHINAQYKLGKQNIATAIQVGNYLNYTYFNSILVYAQAKSISYLQARVKIGLNAGFWHLDNYLTLQKNTNNNVLNVPLFTSQTAVYWEANVFKKAMRARIGLDIFYMSSYKQYAYIPTAADFALTTLSGGNYPLFDLFVNGQVKNFNIYLKLEHFNSNINIPSFNPEFNSSSFEPMQKVNFKLGIGWRFFN